MNNELKEASVFFKHFMLCQEGLKLMLARLIFQNPLVLLVYRLIFFVSHLTIILFLVPEEIQECS